MKAHNLHFIDSNQMLFQTNPTM